MKLTPSVANKVRSVYAEDFLRRAIIAENEHNVIAARMLLDAAIDMEERIQ